MMLWRIPHLHADPIERPVARCIAGDHGQAHAEVGVIELMRCIFNGAALEQMMQYFRVKSMDEVERSLKVNLVNMGFVDETVQFIPPNERWQLNPNVAAMALGENKRLIDMSAASMAANYDNTKGDQPKTATQVMAEVQATTQLVSAALLQAYEYRRFECMEIARRFAKKDSTDPDVKKFRSLCLRDDVSEEALDFDSWDIQVDRVLGGGNKMMEAAIAEKLMASNRCSLRRSPSAWSESPGIGARGAVRSRAPAVANRM